ncbi:hypothetical protein C1I95_15035 [Micromonospora craterilacus]|uniref:Integrase SAM-like N-terminal domain-containing protein n=1 Tax=Micromonospora craterilacus TaxID=1655439 RepID=A0A2W2F7X1_9ACTN|nr:hypothetical protein C1I95_15035 [Micromonospora craterilacus]
MGSVQNVVLVMPSAGAVVENRCGLPWLVMFPDGLVHETAAAWFRELLAGDSSPATLRSYGYDLLRWFRWLDATGGNWSRATREQVRDFVLSCGSRPGQNGAPTWSGSPHARSITSSRCCLPSTTTRSTTGSARC